MNARLALHFETSNESTRMRIGAQDPPLRVIRAFPQANGGTLVHLHNVSGGILAGDRLSLQIDVAAGAIAQVTTTGATRLYRHRPGASDSEQDVSISVAEDALLEYLPDALIPFAGARHKQRTTVTLSDNAAFFWWEVLAPGRQAMGEKFTFDRLQVEIAVRSKVRPLVLESYVLEPHRRSLESTARLGGYTHTATFYAFQIGRSASDLRQLESSLAEMALEVSRPGVTIWGASALASDGVIVRGLSATARDLPATLARFWGIARQFLTGKEAVPPRKLK
ncbi:MAG: urease accessory protein UreD [Acidobacteriota bacterium]